jgi:DNA primase
MPTLIDRIRIPITNAKGDVIGFSGRTNPLTRIDLNKAKSIAKWKNTATTPIFKKCLAILGINCDLYTQIKDFSGIVASKGGLRP